MGAAMQYIDNVRDMENVPGIDLQTFLPLIIGGYR